MFKKMRKIAFLIFMVINFVGLNKIAIACEALEVSIGSDKSKIEQYFGAIEVAEQFIELDAVVKISALSEEVCSGTNLGLSNINVYIVEGTKIGGIEVEMLHEDYLEEDDGKDSLYKYVSARYGAIENNGKIEKEGIYQVWEIGNNEIYYSKYYYPPDILNENLMISSKEYVEHLYNENVFSDME